MFEFKVHIDAPPVQVFDEVSHVERHPSWANPNAQLQVEQTSGDGPGLSAHYVSHAIFVRKPVSADIEITKFDPPRVFALKATQHQQGKKDTWIEHTFTFVPMGSGSDVTKKMTGEASVGGAIMGFIAYPAIKKDAMTSLSNLKAMMESKAKAAGAG
jgi:uncharacterized protein YndB with AHSA1/START domain